MNDRYIDFLAEELQNGKLVVFVGAGVSMNSGLPSWSFLVKKYAEYLGIEKENYTSEEMLEIPEIFYNHFGKIKYYNILEKIFEKNYKFNSIHESLENLQLNYIITTNYDDLIENKLNETNEYDIIKKEEELAYSKSNKMIIKMHGDIENRNIVLKKSDYDRYEQNFPLITTFVKSLFTTNTVLFIGYSLNDINVKNIMKWISDILNEDFRRVYLVDFEKTNDITKYNDKKNKLVNRISLQCEKSGDKEKALTDFLNKLSNNKKKKEIEENFKIYENLNYLTENNLKKIIKNVNISEYETSDEGLIINRKISIESLVDKNMYREILVKSRINKMIINKPEKIEIELLNEKNEEILEIVESIITYDKTKFENSKKNVDNQYLIVYGLMFFQKFDKAEETVKKISEKFKPHELTKENIIWNNFILLNIQKEKARVGIKENHKIDLEKIYKKNFKNETELSREIFENLTLKKIELKIEDCLYKLRETKNSCILGSSSIKNAKYITKDAFNHCIFNGISLRHPEMYKIIKKYSEIIFMAYTNEVDMSNSFFGESSEFNKIDSFEYFDIFMMMQLSLKDLELLFNDYKIKNLKCDNLSIEKALESFKNILSLEEFNQTEIRLLLEKKLFLLSRMSFTKEQSEKILKNILNNENNYQMLFIDNIQYKGCVNNFVSLFYKIIENLCSDSLKKLIIKIIEENKPTKYNENSINFLTYYFKEKTIEKIKETEEVTDFLKNSDSKTRLYISRVLEEKLAKNIINQEKEKLLKEFKVEIYILMINEGEIVPCLNKEKLIVAQIESLLNSSYGLNTSIEIILSNLFFLFLNNLVTKEFIEYMKDYKNENFLKYIEKNGHQNILRYSLDRENFNFSLLGLSDLKIFTKKGIKKLLKTSNNNSDFIFLIQNYIKSRNGNDEIVEAYLEFINGDE